MKRQTRYARKLREEVITHYGPCACCGEPRKEFLILVGLADPGKNAYLRIKREGYPDRYWVNCANCRRATRLYGACPHKNLVAGLQ